jgi:hypothetical protein
MSQNIPHPLFVLGKQRLGTTWLASQLCEHPLIAGVRHEHHHGILASHFLSIIRFRYGDLRKKTNFIEFVEAISVTDTFRFMEVDKDFLYSLWPISYEDLFRTVMAMYAEKQGACYWLDKTNEYTPLVHEIAQKYPDAKFIGIIRNIEDVLPSTFGRYSKYKNKKYDIVKNVFSWTWFNKVMLNFAKTSNRIHIVRYENLKRDMQTVMIGICDFLSVEFDDAMLTQAYSSNTTFRQGRPQKEEVLSPSEKKLAGMSVQVSSHLPLAVLNWRAFYKKRFQKRKALPEWLFLEHPMIQMKRKQR